MNRIVAFLILIPAFIGCGGGAIRKGYETSERMEVVIYNGAVSRVISQRESRTEKDSLPESYGELLKELAASIPAGLWVQKPVELHLNPGRMPTFQLTANDGLGDLMSAAEGTAIGSAKPRSLMDAHKANFKGSLIAVIQTHGLYDPNIGGITITVRLTMYDRVQGTLVLDRVIGKQVIEADPDAPYARLNEGIPLKALKATVVPMLKKTLERMRSQEI